MIACLSKSIRCRFVRFSSNDLPGAVPNISRKISSLKRKSFFIVGSRRLTSLLFSLLWLGLA